MNREIKFRGQQINTKKWVYGYLYRNKGLYVICENIRYAEEEPILLDTVGQYTGLDDKNGKEIYEGDIAKYENMTGKIMFFNGSFILSDLEETEEWELGVINEEIEVIGNVFEKGILLNDSEKSKKN